MPNFPPDSSRSGRDGNRRSLRDLMDAGNGSSAASRAAAARRPPSDPWGGEPPASDEIENTSAEENERILAALRAEQGLPSEPEAEPEPEPVEDDPQAVAEMNEENERLRGIVAELRQLLDETTSKGNESWGERETEYEAMLEEKSQVIRDLHARIQELQGDGAEVSESADEDSGESQNADLSAMSDELERERCALEQERRRLEDDRRQLREDEESMMRQMREMELQMARERAELARQRNELQRLHSEIRHELELAQRDAAVNERLRLLQRRPQQETTSDKPEEGKPTPRPTLRPTKKSEPNTTPKKAPDTGGGGGMFRRFFGGGGDK